MLHGVLELGIGLSTSRPLEESDRCVDFQPVIVK
jgi:hypothetical protein